jgi:hypothetical protein
MDNDYNLMLIEEKTEGFETNKSLRKHDIKIHDFKETPKPLDVSQ